MINWFIEVLRNHPELAIFLTLSIGFYVGKLKFKGFSLGIVTSVLLVGVLVGQLNISISPPLKSVFFLMFLFAIGYKVGPQFFRGLRKDGLPQVWFTILMLISVLATVWGCSIVMGYNPGEAAGLLSGSQTISAVIGVSTDTINSLSASNTQKQEWLNMIPVAYAITYIFGTAGSAWVLASIGPKLLGGINKVRTSCKELESRMGNSLSDQPGYISAQRNVSFRSYNVTNIWFNGGKTAKELEEYYESNGRILFVERVQHNGNTIDDVTPDTKIYKDDIVVLSGRREYMMNEDTWIGNEIYVSNLLDFPIEVLMVVIHNKEIAGHTVEDISKMEFMEGVSIRTIHRAGVKIPVFAKTIIDSGDNIEIMGLRKDCERAGKKLGYVEHHTNASDIVYIGLGILIGGLFGALAIHFGGIPISLSTSGGALIAGLVFGWWRSTNPSFGQIPEPALWFMNNVGLNMFIAVVGITSGPSFIEGLKEIGISLFVVGIIATTIPLLVGVLIGRYVFKFHPALTLGCTAGARTTTAALGAVQEAIQSETPALGYTITYAVGNTMLIIWGVVIVLLIN